MNGNPLQISATLLLVVAGAALLMISACQRPQGEKGGTNGDPAFQNSYWKLVELGESGPVNDSGSAEAHLIFGGDSSVTGRTGCNHLSGKYARNGDAIRFEPLITTKMACPDRMELEQRFLAALGATQRWKISGGKLELYDGAGKMLARFEAREKM